MRHLFALLIATLLFAQTPSAKEPVALLLTVTGKWTLDNSQPAVRGMKLFDGQTLRLDNDSIRGRVGIVYLSGDADSCPSARDPDCAQVTVRSRVPAATSLFGRVFKILQDSFNPETPLVPGITRSASVPDAYAELRGNLMSINSPDTVPSSKVNYSLQFRRIRSNSILDPPISGIFSWQPGSPLVNSGVVPGLYRVNLLDGSAHPTGDFFILFVPPPQDSGRFVEEFKTLVAVSEGWGSQNEVAATVARRQFLFQSALNSGVL